MADTLKDFLVRIAYEVDEASQKAAEEKVAGHERAVTAATDRAGQERIDREKFRQALRASGNDLTKVKIVEAEKQAAASIVKVHQEGTDRLTKIDVEAQKKATERRSTAFKDISKGALATEAVLTKVAGLAGIVGTALTGASFFQGLVGAAGAYANAAQQSQRTGSSVKGIQALLYGFTQVGLNRDEANNSFEGFRSALARNPGLKFLLRNQAGIDTEQTPDKVFAQLGRYFSSMPKNVALERASQLGISENTMLALENPALAGKITEGEQKPDQFGLDPDKAAKEGRDMTAAYERLATDLATVKDKVEAQFFKPMTEGFNQISGWLEKNPEVAVKFGEGMTAFAGLMALSVVPKILRLASAITGIGTALSSLPAWLLRLLAVPGVAAGGIAGAAYFGSTTAANAGEGNIRSDGIHMPDGSIRPNSIFDPNAQDGRLAGGPTVSLPRSESSLGRAFRQRPKWLGGEGKGGARERLGQMDNLPTGPVAGANGYGLIDAPYRASVDRKGEGGYLSPREMYNYLKTQGASDNEALLLTGAAGSESSFNPNAVHDGGRGHGLFGHNDQRLDMRGRNWQQQASAALAEIRRRSEHSLVESARTDEELADAEMHFENPRGYTRRNPRGGDNYTGRLGTIRRFRGQLQGGPTFIARDSRGNEVRTDAQGRAIGSDGKPTTVKTLNPYGTLDPNAFKSAPLAASSPTSMYAAYDNRRGDAILNQNVTVNGVQKPNDVANEIRLSARRGAQDSIRLMQGATQ